MKICGITKTIAIIIALFMAAGCTGNVAGSEQNYTPVETYKITADSIKNEIVYSGRISASESVYVISKISGKVAEVCFDVGDSVREGDVLFRLDEKDIKDQISQLESQLGLAEQGIKAAENALTQTTGGQYQSTISQLEAAVANAEKQLESAKLVLKNAELTLTDVSNSFESMKILYAAGALSKNDYEKAEIGYSQATSGVEQAKITLSQAETGYKTAKDNYDITVNKTVKENTERAGIGVSQAELSRNSVAIQLQIALDTLADASIKAPISGVVSARAAKAGEYTSSQSPAYQIVNSDKVNVDVKVSEIIINNIKAGDEIDVFIKTIGSEPVKGVIKTVSPAADQTNMYPVQIELGNADGTIKPGMFAEALFVKESADNAIVLPRNAVLKDENTHYVYVNENAFAAKVPVTVGIDNGAWIEILSGIDMTSEVIVTGQDYLSDGDSIRVTGTRGK